MGGEGEEADGTLTWDVGTEILALFSKTPFRHGSVSPARVSWICFQNFVAIRSYLILPISVISGGQNYSTVKFILKLFKVCDVIGKTVEYGKTIFTFFHVSQSAETSEH